MVDLKLRQGLQIPGFLRHIFCIPSKTEITSSTLQLEVSTAIYNLFTITITRAGTDLDFKDVKTGI